VHARIPVVELGPPSLRNGQHVEATDRGESKDLVEAVCRQGDVNVLRDSADVPVKPYGPAAADDGLAAYDLEQVIDRPDDTSVTAGQILGRHHGGPPGQELVGQLQLLGESRGLDHG